MNSKEYKKLCLEANNKKLRLINKLQTEIKRLYNKIDLKALESDYFISNDKFIDKHIKDTLKLISEDILAMQEHIEDIITEYVNEIAIEANKPQEKMLLDLDKAFTLGLSSVIVKMFKDIHSKPVRFVLNGKLYKDKASIKKRVRKALNKNIKDLKYIAKVGMREGKTLEEINKDLSTYLRVGKTKPIKWVSLYPKASTQADYNIQRMANTYSNHAFQQAQKESCKRNPFVVGIKWLVSNSHKVCPLCQDRNGVVYKIDELPLDHVNGMCTTIPVLEKELDQIGEELKSWIDGESNSRLDNWFKEYGEEFL